MAFLKSQSGKTVTLGTRVQSDGSILLDTTDPQLGRTICTNVDAKELRDALLEAFPLEEAEPDLPVAKKRYAPGTVVSANYKGARSYVILPEGYYDLQCHQVFPRFDFFDPRDAVALHNPLAKFRVGDTATRKKDGVTETFEVQHIDRNGFIGPHSDRLFNPRDFSSDREQLDRLPAGTIVRLRHDGVRLITAEGGIHLTGHVNADPGFRDSSDYGAMVKQGDAEVIYLP